MTASCSSGSVSQVEETTQVADTQGQNSSNAMPLAEAAYKYAQLVTATNCALAAYTAVEGDYAMDNGQVDLSGLYELTNAAERISVERQSAIEELVTSKWPVEVSDDMEALALFWATVQRAEKNLSVADDLNSWNSAIANLLEVGKGPESGRSKIIRIKLGLGEFSNSECD
jgi:hypothetical protein